MHHQIPININKPYSPLPVTPHRKGVPKKIYSTPKIPSDREAPSLFPPTTTNKSRHQMKVSIYNNLSPN